MNTANLPALVVFDLGGTTVGDEGQVPAAFAEALESHGIALTPDQLLNVRGSSKRSAIQTLVPEGPVHARRVEEVYAAFQNGLCRRYRDGGVSPVPGAETTFSWLRARGVRIALNTGFDRVITELLLRALDWANGVADEVICAEDVLRGRPAPDLILRAMERTGIHDPQDVANVGDTTLDLHAGHRAGVRFNVGVLSGAHDRERLLCAPHTHLLNDVGELPSLFRVP